MERIVFLKKIFYFERKCSDSIEEKVPNAPWGLYRLYFYGWKCINLRIFDLNFDFTP